MLVGERGTKTTHPLLEPVRLPGNLNDAVGGWGWGWVGGGGVNDNITLLLVCSKQEVQGTQPPTTTPGLPSPIVSGPKHLAKIKCGFLVLEPVGKIGPAPATSHGFEKHERATIAPWPRCKFR